MLERLLDAIVASTDALLCGGSCPAMVPTWIEVPSKSSSKDCFKRDLIDQKKNREAPLPPLLPWKTMQWMEFDYDEYSYSSDSSSEYSITVLDDSSLEEDERTEPYVFPSKWVEKKATNIYLFDSESEDEKDPLHGLSIIKEETRSEEENA